MEGDVIVAIEVDLISRSLRNIMGEFIGWIGRKENLATQKSLPI